MKLIEIYRNAINERDALDKVTMASGNQPPIDPETDEESKVVLLINQLEQQPEVIQQLQNLQLLSSKYKAVQQFASLLGIKPEQFHQVMQQARIQSTI